MSAATRTTTPRNAPWLPTLLAAGLLLAPAAVAWGQNPPKDAPQENSEDAPVFKTPANQGVNAATIVAVVNGDVISADDVNNRRLLFAGTSGIPTNPEVLDRLAPQVAKQLIDEKLRLQEIQRRHIVVSDQDIAKTIEDVETRNGMAPGTLQKRLAADGVALRTLIDQIRVQIGWGRVLRQELGEKARVSDADIAERERLLKEQIGKTEYRVSEIFIPIDNPDAAAEAQKFADTVIGQLRAGAPFAVAAAQFSQSQTALQGGDLGWVQATQLDPAQVAILDRMPVGAISNPIRVPGGLSIVTLRGKREIGHDVTTQLTIRQAFAPFSTPLNPQAPTPQQQQALEQAKQLSATAHDCDTIEAANKRFGSGRPSDPGQVTLETLAPAMAAILSKLDPGKPSQPLVAQDGIAVVMVCSKETANSGLPSKRELEDRILADRVELASRQLQRELRRRAIIEERA
jgi:peptidyl-prolyl cis-trans isomerase SurA